MKALILALLVAIPPSVPNELSATIPYSDNIKEDFEKKVGELIRDMKSLGCLRGTVNGVADDGIKVIRITITCLEWNKELPHVSS